MKKSLFFIPLFFLFFHVLPFGTSCLGLNLFSVEDDKDLGAQVDAEIESNPSEYPIAEESDFPDAYAYLRGIRDEILDSGRVNHANDFDWEIHIIEDDGVLNAFCTPGGYIYFYTGLMKYLDTEDALAGVMGHEIAHAAERHVTESLTDQFGTDLLLEAAFGNNLEIVQEIAGGLSGLAFSRAHESDADEHSVIYLAETRYQCNGVALFFEKLINEGDASSPPEFLSTHPNPDNRVEAINAKAQDLGCSTTPSGRDYDAFKALLP